MEETMMEDIITIPIILKLIRELNKQKSSIYYHGLSQDYYFDVQKPCSNSEVNKLENKIGSIPNDYKEFLLSTNGLSLSNLVSSKIYDLESLHLTKEIFSDVWHGYPKNFLIIGDMADGSIHVLLDLDARNDCNVYIIDIYADEHFSSLNCGFTEFLNRFVLTYGSRFWEWGAVKTDIKSENN